MLTWQPIDTETLPEIGPADYPDRLASLHFEAGMAALRHQHSQAAVLDSKLAVAGGTALATVALTLSALSTFASPEQTLGDTELWLTIIGTVTLLFGFANSARGLWPRIYRSLPDLPEIRELVRDQGFSEEDARWSIATSVEQAVEINRRVMNARLATARLVYCSLILGIATIVAAFGLHLARLWL